MGELEMGKRTIAAAVSVAALVILTAACATGGSSNDSVNPRGSDGSGSEGLANGTPDEPGYPKNWEARSVDEASQLVSFALIDPPTSLTEAQQVSNVFVFPDNVAVAIDFTPQPHATETRQNYIEIYEAAWSGGDPAKEFAETVESTPYDSDQAFDLNGVPATTVEPNSPGDAEGANPAYVEFVVNGIQVQISGGSDLDALLSIAKEMINSTKGTGASG